LDINGNGWYVVFEEFRNIEHIHPVACLCSCYEDVKSKEFMLRGIVYPFLHLLGATLYRVWIVGRPVPSEVLSVDGEFYHFGVELLDSHVDVFELIVEFEDKFSCVVERLVEVFVWVLTGDGDLFG